MGRFYERSKKCGENCIDKDRFQCLFSLQEDNEFSPQKDIFDGYSNEYAIEGCAVELRLLNPQIYDLWEDYQYSDIKDLNYKTTPFLQFFVLQAMKEDVHVYNNAMREKEE